MFVACSPRSRAIGVKYTFGIPGLHNTELYDELNSRNRSLRYWSHTKAAAPSWRSHKPNHHTIGCLAIVPAAGMTHAMSGIGEAYLDGIPLLISQRNQARFGKHYQLHDVDQQRILDGITKAAFLVDKPRVIPTIYPCL